MNSQNRLPNRKANEGGNSIGQSAGSFALTRSDGIMHNAPACCPPTRWLELQPKTVGS